LTATIDPLFLGHCWGRSRAVENRVLLRPVASFMLESIREINAEAAATRRYLESMS